jgi:two-component system chemotaxis sensor kinase CheA
MSIRMMPISVVFSRFPRVVRDLAQKLNKQIELKTIGEGTELDKGLIERIADPLTHLVRNSLDHGIEMPDERTAKGKSPVGNITLKAYHQGGNIVIEVADDGAGLDRDRILAKARERGFNVNEQMSDGEVWQLIFEPASPPPSRLPKSPVAASAWTWSSATSAPWAAVSTSNPCAASARA